MQLFSRHRERWNYLILHYILPQKRKAGEQWDWYPWLVWSLQVIWLNHSQVAVRLERSWESHPHRQSYWDITSRQEARLKKTPFISLFWAQEVKLELSKINENRRCKLLIFLNPLYSDQQEELCDALLETWPNKWVVLQCFARNPAPAEATGIAF